jgi:hypothetical protein
LPFSAPERGVDLNHVEEKALEDSLWVRFVSASLRF